MEIKEAQNSQTIMKKKNQVGRLTLSDFKTYYESVVIKTVVLAQG